MVYRSFLPSRSFQLCFGFFSFVGEKKAPENTGFFNLTQLAVPFVTLIAVGVLYIAIHTNLLINIDMQVKGAGSTNRLFRWYIDRSTSVLPQPTIITISDWFWRIGMLLWAVWLVVRLYKWAPWAWDAFTTGGIWKPFSKRVAPHTPRPNTRHPSKAPVESPAVKNDDSEE